MRIGVLAVQGAFAEHLECLRQLSIDCFEIRCKEDLEGKIDGIIFPGGESTVMGKLINELGMKEKLVNMINGGLPVFGTCAGMILLAKNIDGGEAKHIGTMDITVKRNAYGRQLGSFEAKGSFGKEPVDMTFIRAPYVKSADSDSVEILSIHQDKIVAVREKNQLATAYHPELTKDLYIHKYFVDMCKSA